MAQFKVDSFIVELGFSENVIKGLQRVEKAALQSAQRIEKNLNKGFKINTKQLDSNLTASLKSMEGKINKTFDVSIFIEKNIPVCAGLAGGSTDGAGVLYGLNKILDYPLTINELHELAQKLGSDLNFCLEGGTVLCTGRGEILTKMPFYNFKLSLVKPKHLKISAKEAYQAFDLIKKESNMRNDLEFALLESKKYPELEFLSSLGLQMSGSGPTYFLRDKNFDVKIDMKDYLIINDLNSVSHGVVEA